MALLEQGPWVPELHRHLHRQKGMKFAFAILMTNLQQMARTKLQKGSKRELLRAKWTRQQQTQSLQKSPQAQKRSAVTAI